MKIPNWIYYYALFLFILSLTTTFLGFLFPEKIFLGIDIGTSRVVSDFYATRNLGIACAFGIGLLLRNDKVFLCIFFMRAIIETFDLFFTLKYSLINLAPVWTIVIWLLVFLLPEYIAIYTLYKRKIQ